jgi:hypothetical protein
VLLWQVSKREREHTLPMSSAMLCPAATV